MDTQSPSEAGNGEGRTPGAALGQCARCLGRATTHCTTRFGREHLCIACYLAVIRDGLEKKENEDGI